MGSAPTLAMIRQFEQRRKQATENEAAPCQCGPIAGYIFNVIDICLGARHNCNALIPHFLGMTTACRLRVRVFFFVAVKTLG